MEKKLFSIILLHYNQPNYIYEAINSILNQTYDNIELIICDDCSKFNSKEIKKYIKDNNKGNIKKLEFIINEKNLGTVKTVNKALKTFTGDYVLIFAADDCLHNDKVIETFEYEFRLHDLSNIISFQALMYDHELNKNSGGYVDLDRALLLNDLGAEAQFKELSCKCIYAAGSTAYRRIVFEENGLIDEKYRLIEDLSYWLKLTRNGNDIYFYNYIGLKHRDGGVSKEENKKVNKNVNLYYKDLLLIYVDEIIPYLKRFNKNEKIDILNTYENLAYHLKINDSKLLNEDMIIKKIYIKYPVYIFYKLKILTKRVIKKMIHFAKRLILKFIRLANSYLTYMIWLLLNLVVLKLSNNLVIIIVLLANYYISTIIYKIIKKIYKVVRGA